uniref:non-specific serine/threonine protein kinase n=1 Tax=Cyanistes caeruleus TaxID=156563 RepID=A0A8C0U001_CYACU
MSCNWPPREQRNGLLQCHSLITPVMRSNHKALGHSLAVPFQNHLLHVCCGLMLSIFSNYSFSMSFEVAIKKINVQGVNRKILTMNEIRIMESNRSPRIVNYLASYLVHEELWLVMEYMDGGTLRDLIDEIQMSEGEIAAVSREVRDPICASKALSCIVWETGAQNGSDFMGQAWFLCCSSAMGKQEHLKGTVCQCPYTHWTHFLYSYPLLLYSSSVSCIGICSSPLRKVLLCYCGSSRLLLSMALCSAIPPHSPAKGTFHSCFLSCGMNSQHYFLPPWFCF